ADRPFAAGDTPTIADCTLFAALQFGQFFGVDIPAECGNLQRWYTAFQQRHSTAFEFPE
ncbi:MAG: glutathione binding-like protein, partial [Halioglobus sp.]